MIQDSISEPALRSPDGTWALHAPHIAGVRLHLGVFFRRGNEFVSHREYVTPYGLLAVTEKRRVNQTALSGPPTEGSATAALSGGDSTAPIAEGKTSRGDHWYLLAVDKSRDLHVQFKDSTMDCWVPASTPIATIQSLVEEVY